MEKTICDNCKYKKLINCYDKRDLPCKKDKLK